MSIESMAVVLHHSKAGGTDKLVLLGIANHDGDGGAWPSIATLARYANVEPRAVKACIKRLVERGEITRERQAGGTRQMPDYSRPNLYHLKVVCPPECDRSAQHRIDRRHPVLSTTPGVPEGTPGGVSGTYPGGGIQTTPKPLTNQPITTLEKSPVASTSPGGKLPCWNCGENVIDATTRPKSYCTSCSSRGMTSRLIPCTHCGSVRKRAYPGEQEFDCGCTAPAAREQQIAEQWENLTPEQVEQIRNNEADQDKVDAR
ncbi:helix-turn-helix DNA binding domain protein [Arthrobacter phage Kels]|nr:helix-turn-helix DNA binding domain protein [Arthrobacter phage Kels]